MDVDKLCDYSAEDLKKYTQPSTMPPSILPASNAILQPLTELPPITGTDGGGAMSYSLTAAIVADQPPKDQEDLASPPNKRRHSPRLAARDESLDMSPMHQPDLSQEQGNDVSLTGDQPPFDQATGTAVTTQPNFDSPTFPIHTAAPHSIITDFLHIPPDQQQALQDMQRQLNCVPTDTTGSSSVAGQSSAQRKSWWAWN